MVLPSATAIALGVVVLFSGLVGSLLTLRPTHPTPTVVRQPRREPELPTTGSPDQHDTATDSVLAG